MADRFRIDKNYASQWAKGVFKDKDMLNISASNQGQTDTLLLALALGLKEGRRTPSKSSEATVKLDTVENHDYALAMIYAVALNELRKENRDNEISDFGVVVDIIEEYANTGFQKLSELIPDISAFTEEDLELMMLDEMEEVWENIKESMD